MASKDFDHWYGGAPVLPTGTTGDFAAWYHGAPVLQLQLALTVEIVGSGGVEVAGAAVLAVAVMQVASGGVEVAGVASIEIVVGGQQPVPVPGYEIAGRLIPEPPYVVHRPRHFRYEGLVELEVAPRGRWAIEPSEWEFAWPGLVELVVEAGAVVSFDSPMGRLLARALQDDEEGFQTGLF